MEINKESNKSLRELVDELGYFLTVNGYSDEYKSLLMRFWNLLLQYANSKGITHYSVLLGKEFTAYYCEKSGFKSSPTTERAINMLNDWCNFGTVLRRTRKPKTINDDVFSGMFSDYFEHYLKSGLRSSSINQTHSNLRDFVLFLNEERIVSVEEIEARHLYAFMESRFSECSKKTKNRALRDIRYALEYFCEQGTSLKIFEHEYPRIRIFEGSGEMPYAFTKDEVMKILSSVDRVSPLGKRDYAIIMLAIRYGLRASDITKLQFSNIDWNAKSIRITQSKTNEILTLPLIEDVGWAIIDYVEHGRPKTDCQFVFVTHNAPHNKFIGSMNHIIGKHMRAAGITSPANRSHGIHAIRRALATEMLNSNITISAIKEVLGHQSINTTIRYQRMDMKQLSYCALEVPHVQA